MIHQDRYAQLNFAHCLYFQAWGSLKSLKSQTWNPRQVPPGGLLLRIFISWKSQLTSARFERFEITNLGTEKWACYSETTEAKNNNNLIYKNELTFLYLAKTREWLGRFWFWNVCGSLRKVKGEKIRKKMQGILFSHKIFFFLLLLCNLLNIW